jgi:hypothetical protein
MVSTTSRPCAGCLALILVAACTPASPGSPTAGWGYFDPRATASPPPPDAGAPGDDPTGVQPGAADSGVIDPGGTLSPPPTDARGTSPTDAGAPLPVGPPGACSVAFSVTTTTILGSYSPKNVGAIWVTDGNDKFIKTLQVWGAKRRRHLDRWVSSSGQNTVDAITGATMSGHGTRTVTWNCTNANRTAVADGPLRVYVELTEDNNPGQTISVDFVKSGAPVSLHPPDSRYFRNMQVQVNP